MQDELTAEGVNASILGVNELGFESANDLMTEGRDLPWLDEQRDELVWTSWAVTYRDVIVLDGNNEVFGVYNLTDNDLGDASKYAALKQLFVDAAASAP